MYLCMHGHIFIYVRMCVGMYVCMVLLYHGKEEIHSEIKGNYLLTEVVQSNKYYTSYAEGVRSKVGLPTD